MDLEGGYRGFIAWYGDPTALDNCNEWSVNHPYVSAVGTLFNFDQLTGLDCDDEYYIICMSEITLNTGIPVESHERRLAVTNNAYSSNLGGNEGADLICEAEASEPGWKALLFNNTNYDFVSILDFPNALVNSRWLNLNGDSFQPNFPSINTAGTYQNYLSEGFAPFLSEMLLTFFNGTYFTDNILLHQGGDSFSGIRTCNNWTTDASDFVEATVRTNSYPEIIPNNCDIPKHLMCISPIVAKTFQTAQLQIATSTTTTTGNTMGFSGANDICGGDFFCSLITR